MIVDTAFVAGQTGTEHRLPSVGTKIIRFKPTPEQVEKLLLLLEDIGPMTVGGVKHYTDVVDENAGKISFYVYFMLRPRPPNRTMDRMKNKLANALEDSGIAKEAMVVANINSKI
ncbi:hypothetical protein H6785_03765 [Candidatus Nomurabacteria bacterium]|nr:hypothetical protein [Candidatus Nomurabacteria bacterium]